MSTTTGGELIEMLRSKSVALQMGARPINGLIGNVAIPKRTAATTAQWLASEATAITVSQQTLGHLTLTPKTVGAYTEISRRLLLKCDPSAEEIVTADFPPPSRSRSTRQR